jgi:Flp pilus assembly pilin Flp
VDSFERFIPLSTQRGTAMNRLIEIARWFGRDERGVSIVEYTLMLALITIVCFVVITALGAKVNEFFRSFSATI